MKKSKPNVIVLNGKEIKYFLKESPRARYVRLSMREQDLVVHVPWMIKFKEIEKIIKRHQNWILKQLKILEKEQDRELPFNFENGASLPLLNEIYKLSSKRMCGKNAYWKMKDHVLEICVPECTANWIYPAIELWYREMAERYISERIQHWARKMNLKYNRIRIKNQRSLWGSCSQKGNLNFNWRIMLLTQNEADYLMIHELSHLLEMNHSPRFWLNVRKYCPNLRTIKLQLRNNNYLLKFPQESMFS